MLQLLSILKGIKDKNSVFFINNLIIVLIFTLLYYFGHYYIEQGFEKITKDKEDLTLFDFLHFSFVTQTTNGYGDVLITSPIMKFINMLHLITLLAFNLIIFF